jgi:threonine dehydrogenase-like Zn-dependent dehydrogenase
MARDCQYRLDAAAGTRYTSVMRATVMRAGRLVVDTVPDPEPQQGEALVRTLGCGICGSDLHALRHADQMVGAARESGMPFDLDPSRDLVMGHEFAAEVLDYGPDTPAHVAPGTPVVSMPMLFRGGAVHPVGYSNDVPGGYAERMVLNASLMLPIPNGLPADRAALTEPMAVGEHAVQKGQLGPHDAALVYGCGPVGLAVVAALARKGVEPIVAADYSPMRRQLAARMGVHRVVDPREEPVIDAHREVADLRSTVIFECVGVPGMLEQLMREAPLGSRIVVAGVCMEPDRIKPMVGIAKELSLQFVFGYTPGEFADTLRAIAEGEIDVARMVTGRVGVGGVAGAFDDLGRPDAHAKILVEPWRD